MNALEFRELRKKMGLTQAELAALLGVSLSTIVRVEKSPIVPEIKARAILQVAHNA